MKPDIRQTSLLRRFRLEIGLVVVVKAILLAIVWKLWFAHPVAPDMVMPEAVVESHLLGSTASPTSAFPTSDSLSTGARQ